MESFYSFAVDLGGTTAKCAIINNDKIVNKFIVETKKGQILENIYEHFIEECKFLKIDEKDFEFLAFTICGLIDYEKGLSIWAGNLGWSNYDVLNEIKRIFKATKVFILNDSKAATFGEYILGIEKNIKNVLFYTIGTGIGGGVIWNGELIFGNNTKLASEPGHSGGFQNEFLCKCGLNGCIEGLSSATGIEKILNVEKDYFNKKLSKNLNKITIKDISCLVKEKDKKTINLLKKCLTPLAKHISVSLHLMDFDVIVIGGGPSALGEELKNILTDILKDELLKPFYDKLDLRIAKVGNDAGIWGVYYYAKKQLVLNS